MVVKENLYKILGYRQMTAAVRQTYDVNCTRSQVSRLLKAHDPQASVMRKGNRLVSKPTRVLTLCGLVYPLQLQT